MNKQALEAEQLVISGEHQLKKYGKFMEKYNQTLESLNFPDDFTTNKISSVEFSPVSIDYNSKYENTNLFELIESDNKVINKILIVFGQICDEIKSMKTDSMIFGNNLLYFDEDLCQLTQSNEILIRFSKFLEFLFKVKYFLQRCVNVGENLIKQLSALFEKEKSYLNLQSSLHFQSVFNYLGDLLMIFVLFDEIFTSSELLRHLIFYKKSVHSVNGNLNQFNNKYDESQIRGLESVLDELEVLFSGKLFKNAIDSMKKKASMKSIKVFDGHFLWFIKTNLVEIGKFENDLSDFCETTTIIKINIMILTYQTIFGNLDQKSIKTLIDINIKHCGITLIGNIIWRPENFIRSNAGSLFKGHEKYLKEESKIRQIFLTNRTQNLFRDTQSYSVQISMWVLQINESIKSTANGMKMDQLELRCNLLLQGIQFAGQISHIIKSVTNLHVLLKIPMSKNSLFSICKLIEFLKILQITFNGNLSFIVETVQCVLQHLEYQALFIVKTAKKKFANDMSDRNLDILTSLEIVKKCLYGPGTTKRALIARLALSAADPNYTFTSDYIQKLEKLLIRLETIAELKDNIKRCCNPSFLYWHQSIFSIYLKQTMDQKMDFNKINYMINSTNHFTEEENFTKSDNFQCILMFKETVSKELNQEIILKICNYIETYLRLDFHSNLQLETNNPFQTTIHDYRCLIRSKPLQINGKHIVIKNNIEHYLSNMFYNLTTVALADWKTYGGMRRLAADKFNLFTFEDHLPTQTLEQGLDVLEIMRNIQVFVSRYLYNLNNQIFIEQSSNNKHLNTINIRHVANSLRTHGTGIINTTVNFTYQFLKKKFYVFSQFMYDEHIKSRLLKDLKYFRDNRIKLNQTYSYERADDFNKGIKKLGLSPEGQSYLDLFRLVISHIGNAMGYVRMIRSGGLHLCSNATVYLPVLDENLKFTDLLRETGVNSENLLNAAKILEYDIRNLSKNYTQGTNYFKLLVEAFAQVFQNPKNDHLKNFYLIIPPLTINFIEHILTAKDKMTKKNKEGAIFTDDGFAIGLAYILKLLDQTSEFNSLRWFNSVRSKYSKEKERLEEQKTKITNDDVKLQHTLMLTEKRIRNAQQEFDLLYSNLSSAKIFFS